METYFIETWGCQMNVLDSQRLEGLLQRRGLHRVERAADADVAVLNTCSVREKAVQKVLSRLGELHGLRRESGRPGVLGLCGCVGEQEGARLLARSAGLDFVLGPGRVSQLPHALDAVAEGRRASATGFPAGADYDPDTIARGSGARQYVTAIHGCNQHCTFCIVPYTRGHESSRPMSEIVREVREVVEHGGREITLLGQTINAYRCPATGAGFGDLLQQVGAVPGVWRVQFVTSHPSFFTRDTVEKMASVPTLGSYLHLPFQAGSDAVLKRMRRGYTRTEYLELVSMIRAAMPQVTLSTDVIVGFPGETEEDFAATLDVVRAVRFGQLYGFVFSARPRTPAARYGGGLTKAEAAIRLERLFDIQASIQLDLNQAMVGRSVELLLDGPAKRGTHLWQGRGPDNRVVNVPGWPGAAPGSLVEVTITGATPHSLLGERAADRARPA